MPVKGVKRKPVPCPKCGGTGRTGGNDKCNPCLGSGYEQVCKACGGTKRNSKGEHCVPCNATGIQGRSL